jgi:hypothetical protein
VKLKLKEVHQRLPGCAAAAKAQKSYLSLTCPPLMKGVFMGFFDKLFGRQSGNNRELIAKLDSVDFIQASRNIEYTFEILGKQAQEQDYLVMLQEEMLIAVGNYIKKPSLERAITLIEQYPSYLPMFESAKNPLRKLS